MLKPSNIAKITLTEDRNLAPSIAEVGPLTVEAPDLDMKEGLATPSDDCKIVIEADSIAQLCKIRKPTLRSQSDCLQPGPQKLTFLYKQRRIIPSERLKMEIGDESWRDKPKERGREMQLDYVV